MKSKFIKYRCQIVKENVSLYECDKIGSPSNVKNIAIKVLQMDLEPEEVFVVLGLDTKNKVNSIFEVSRGSINSSIVEPREVFKRLLGVNCTSFICIHNHPSGDPSPSKEDMNVAKRLKECGELMRIPMLDFTILGEDDFVSFKEKGLI